MKYQRLDCNRMIAEDAPFPLTIFANQQVKMERKAFEELEGLVRLADTMDAYSGALPELFGQTPCIERVAITPDFHKGTGIPIGTSVKTAGGYFPKAMGSDIGCGMALFVLNGICQEDIQAHKDTLVKRLRHIFWEGGRSIPLNKEQRQAIFTSGIAGLYATAPGAEGLWEYLERFKSTISGQAAPEFAVPCSPVFDAFCGSSKRTYDSQIGSIGGGNHFVELQFVKNIKNSYLASLAGIRENSLLVMAHSGSLSVGSMASFHIDDMLRRKYPKHLKKPYLDFYPVAAQDTKTHSEVMALVGNAANFSAVNRLMLGLMVVKAISETVRPVEQVQLVYDACHNTIEMLPEERFIHRKGACRANVGEHVIIPGSMGASSFLMAGLGNEESLRSSCHGAGRAHSRGESMKSFDADFEKFMNTFTVVSSVDFNTLRTDVKKKKLEELKQEAPFAYKSITPVIDTVVDSCIAKPVAELFPLMTLKN